MPKAIWNEAILAESNKYEIVEGNFYFPPKAINDQYFRKSDTQTTCPWKGKASYYHLEVDGKINRNAAWYYPSPSKAAQNIKGYVAFWNGVKIETMEGESRPGPGSLLTVVKRLLRI